MKSFWDKISLSMKTLGSPAGPMISIISGLRRVGKSTLLAQVAHKDGQEKFYYINFEDDRFLGFKAEDANDPS
jgi:predicted AAA+ superfamily ATPase